MPFVRLHIVTRLITMLSMLPRATLYPVGPLAGPVRLHLQQTDRLRTDTGRGPSPTHAVLRTEVAHPQRYGIGGAGTEDP
jgi:hypothetical protein